MQYESNNAGNVDYRQLIQQNKFREAADILLAMPEVSDNDSQKRDLALCLMKLNEPAEALDILHQLDSLEFQDYRTLVFSYWQLADWDNMASTSKEMLKIEQRANIYYYLAIAERGEKPSYRLDEASKQIIRGYLLQAIQFDDCDLQPFLWLADMCEPQDYEKRTHLIEDALKRFPAESVVRLRWQNSIYIIIIDTLRHWIY